MTPSGLRAISDASGGAVALAALLKVTPRIVYCWLAGTVPITPSREDQIVRLARERGWLS